MLTGPTDDGRPAFACSTHSRTRGIHKPASPSWSSGELGHRHARSSSKAATPSPAWWQAAALVESDRTSPRRWVSGDGEQAARTTSFRRAFCRVPSLSAAGADGGGRFQAHGVGSPERSPGWVPQYGTRPTANGTSAMFRRMRHLWDLRRPSPEWSSFLVDPLRFRPPRPSPMLLLRCGSAVAGRDAACVAQSAASAGHRGSPSPVGRAILRNPTRRSGRSTALPPPQKRPPRQDCRS